jgi:hypothetical protein
LKVEQNKGRATMSKGSFLATVFCLLALSLSAPIQASAQPAAANAETSAAIQSSVAERLAIAPGTVAATFRGPVIEVSIQSAKPDRSRADYTNESSMVEEEVVTQIANKPEYQGIHTIRVKYMSVTASGRPKLLRSVDYRRNVHGLFEKHGT